MAGIYLFFGREDSHRINRAAKSLQFFDEEREVLTNEFVSIAWLGHDDVDLFGPARDESTGTLLLTSGRVSWDEIDWSRAEGLAGLSGGLSNRLLLERYLQNGIGAVERHNGPAVVVIWDPRTATLHILTDHFGYHPAFLYKPENFDEAVFSTFPDAIASDSRVSVSHDFASMAEFLSAWRITPPNTYYSEIKYAGPATRHSWRMRDRKYERREYWRPFESGTFRSLDEAADQLAGAVRNAVRIRTLERLAPVVSFTSGGMDSRAILFSAAAPSALIGLNMYDVPNRESGVSKRLCEAAGTRYIGFGRDEDYYPRWLPEAVRISGAMWSHEDNHYLGARDTVMSLGARTVMTACTTDWLFKGYGLEKTYARFLGRNLPIKVFTHDRVDGFLPNMPRGVPPKVATEANERMQTWFQGTPSRLLTDPDWLAVEDRRVRPTCYAVSVSGQMMYRIFPYDTFLGDAAIAECYSRSKAKWKINADLWGKAVRQLCVGGESIEDANFGWRVGSSTVEKLRAFGVGWIRRRLSSPRLQTRGLATEGSWPNMGWYARNSTTLASLWNGISPATRDIVREAWGSDPWAIPLADWADTPHNLFRLLTLATHLDQRSGASR